jgi:hypothetical protein
MAGKIYWTDRELDKIKRANLDGSEVEEVVATGLLDPFGIALFRSDPGFEDRDKYGLMTGAGPTNGGRSDDWSTLVSTGPINLGAGESVRVAFAIAGATTEAALAAAISDASATWQGMATHPCEDPLSGVEEGEELPSLKFSFAQNVPNPFNPTTKISFVLPEAEAVTLQIFDMQGRLVRSLLDGENRPAGRSEMIWNGLSDEGRSVASGTYFYRVEAGEFEAVRKMALVR